MAWDSSNRRDTLPPDWSARRLRRLERDGWKCRWIVNGQRCAMPATDVDHIIPHHKGGDDEQSNLRSLCSEHHNHKSGQEGRQAQLDRKREISSRFRRIEAHPGLL